MKKRKKIKKRRPAEAGRSGVGARCDGGGELSLPVENENFLGAGLVFPLRHGLPKSRFVLLYWIMTPRAGAGPLPSDCGLLQAGTKDNRTYSSQTIQGG